MTIKHERIRQTANPSPGWLRAGNVARLAVLLGLFLLPTLGIAQTYTLPSGPLPEDCSANGNTVTCTDDVELEDNQSVAVNGTVDWIVDGDFSIADDASVNAGGTPPNLQLDVSGSFNAEGRGVVNADVDSSGSVSVEGDAAIGGALASGSDVELAGRASVGGGIVADGTFSAADDSSVGGDVAAGGEVTLEGRAETGGGISSEGSVEITDDASTGGSLTAGGSLTLSGRGEIGGRADVRNDIDVVDDAEILGGVSSDGAVTLTGRGLIAGSLDATSAVQLSDNSTIDGNVISRDSVTLNNTSEITGCVSAPTVTVNDSSTVGCDADLVLLADQTTVEIGEDLTLAVAAQNCAAVNADRWRDTWRDQDGLGIPNDGQQPTTEDSPCTAQRIRSFTVNAAPGDYTVEFESEWCRDGVAGQSGNVFECPTNSAGGTQFEPFAESPVAVQITVVEAGLPEPLLEYRMEESAWTGAGGEVTDESGNDRDGTAVGGADTAFDDPAIPGNPGTCRYGEFDGNDDGIDESGADSYLNGLDAITVTAWVFNGAALSGNDRGVFFTDDTGSGQDNRLGMRYDTGGFFGGGSNVIKASVATSECDPSGECVQIESTSDLMVRDEWQHLALTWTSGGDLKLFVDGAEVATSAEQGQGTGGTIDSVDRLMIGQGAKGDRWQGRIDEFRIYPSALDPGAITAIRDATHPCAARAPDHIRIDHPGSGVTCSPEAIQLRVCANADCSELFDDPVDVTLTSPAGNWQPQSLTVDGSASVALQVPEPGTVTLDAEATSPEAADATRCFTGGSESCQMTWADSGFVVAIPDHVSAVQQTASVKAVRTSDEALECTPAFSNETKSVDFTSSYIDPGSGVRAVTVDGQDLPLDSSAASIDLAFDGNGEAQVPVEYTDVGQVGLALLFAGTSGLEQDLEMTGSTAFITRPERFALQLPGLGGGASTAGGPVFAVAGEDFDIVVDALNADGDLTPNFGREDVAEGVDLELALQAPSGGADPGLAGDFNAFGVDCASGTSADPGQACGAFNWPEAGIIELTPRLASGAYLGTEDVVGDALADIGRFIPAQFRQTVADNGEFQHVCSATFTYLGQPFGYSMTPELTITALNAGGAVTRNYTGAYAKLDAGDVTRGGPGEENAATDDNGDPLEVSADFTVGTLSDNGAGTLTYDFSLDDAYRHDPDNTRERALRVAPFDTDLTVDITDISDSDGVSAPAAGREAVEPDAVEIRFGRLVIDGRVGSELAPLALPVRAEYWDGDTWLLNADDGCTALALADDVALTSSTGASAGGDEAVAVGSGSTSIQETSPVSLAAGSAELTFAAPGDTGWVDVELLLFDRAMDTGPFPWLQDDLDADDTFQENPRARAAFGLFPGQSGRIYSEEILD